MNQAQQIALLRQLLNDGDVLYGINHKTNANSDIIQVLLPVVRETKATIEDITRRVAVACGLRLCKKGISVRGTGFNKIAAIAEEVERVTGVKVTGQSIHTDQL